ncbi:Organic solute transport protein 1 [compost metagenome]
MFDEAHDKTLLVNLFLVLIDVTEHMFSKQFQDEVMKPQKLYSYVSIREIFDRLAHSSIMRLSTSSMDKVCSNFVDFNILEQVLIVS